MPGGPHILGISAYYHDAAAALVSAGDIVAAAQEERFSRRKHDERFPGRAIAFCLRHAGLKPDQLDAVVFYDKPITKFARLLESYLAVAPGGWRTFPLVLPGWLGEKLNLRGTIREELPGLRADCPILFTTHHQAHAASAFYPSPFAEAAILTVDGVGEWATTTIGLGRGTELRLLKEIRFPHSLGLLYTAFTGYCGFRVNSGEYKLMGLAPYGEPRFADVIRCELLDLKPDGSFWLNLDYFAFLRGVTMTNERFHRLFGGPPRAPDAPVEQRHMDVARSIQLVTEEIMLRLAQHVRDATGLPHLCLAGGVALNCVANGRILRERLFEQLWIQPAAGDAGGALGAALAAWHGYFQGARKGAEDGGWRMAEARSQKLEAGNQDPEASIRNPTSGIRHPASGIRHPVCAPPPPAPRPSRPDAMHGALLGPEFSDAEIEETLRGHGAVWEHLGRDALLDRTVCLLADGKVVGWFQGRMEFGPRALGSRSILGDPRSPAMQSVMNLKVKFRESFRPFAPIVLRERVADYFELDGDSPYMLLVAPVRTELRRPVPAGLRGLDLLKAERSTLPAITHVDYSARIQTVDVERFPLLHDLLRRWEAATSCAVLVNTSFNVRGEPIVCTPDDAYRCFVNTEMDYLVIGGFVLDRLAQPRRPVERRVAPQPD
jgi:carbamoyltransferase